MLDKIYQSIDAAEDEDTYILFTGDGHFQSVVKYLQQTKNKQVIVYAIKGACSKALKAVAGAWAEIPLDDELLKTHIRLIFDNLYDFEEKRRVGQYATFMKTVEVVAARYQADTTGIHAALHWLIQQGYIESRQIQIPYGPVITGLIVHWDHAREDGLWKPRELTGRSAPSISPSL